jgi:PAS domain S-box-containing protein
MAKILLVDDRPQNLLALEAILEPLGQDLVQAGSGEEALRSLLTHEFAVILLDVQMPGMDGFETAELIKTRRRTRDVPIIFLTAISKEERHVFQGYEVGAVDYVFKPFDPVVLRSKVAVFVDLWQKTQQLRLHEERVREQQVAEVRRVGEERYRRLADAMPQIVWTTDTEGNATYYNRRWFEYTGTRPEETGAQAWVQAVHPDDLPGAVARRQKSLETGGVFEVEYRFRAADGRYRWHLGRALPMFGADGEIEFWIGTATDIHDRKRTEDAQRFLLRAGSELVGSLDYRETLARVARLAVPEFADWCTVHVVEDDDSIRELELAHVDPDRIVFARELQARYPPDPEQPSAAADVIRTGEPRLVPEVTDEMLRAVAVDDIHLDLIRQLGIHSFMCVPLVTRTRTLGAITLVSEDATRSFDAGDLEVALELGRRAGSAIENAHLYREVEQRARAARVLETIADGVMLLDRDDVVLLWNRAAAEITGIPSSDVVGRKAADALPGYAQGAYRIPVDGTPETIPVEVGGRELWLSFTGVLFEDGSVYAFRDLTEERAVERLKSDFVATVSHELRTPLAAIYGAAVTLRRGDLVLEEEMSGRLLDVIGEESERLAQIVNDVLLASHLDSGQLHLTIEACDGLELARGVMAAAEAHAPKGITLGLEAPKALPPVAADPQQLRQVFVNLVENAIKYSPGGGTIDVTVEPVDRHVRFAIRDSGLGIPKSEQRRIFEKFYRLDPDLTRGVGGTGLGLYISRELIERMGGRIWVESSGSGGSTFVAELPVAAT